MAPPAPPASYPAPSRAYSRADEKAKREITLGPSEVEPMPTGAPTRNPYFEQLAKLARELEALARGGANATAMRMLRQRLAEWVENLRSTGGNADLAAAVEALATRLGTAIAGADLANEALAIAAELAHLATGAPPPPAPKKSRAAFWK
jgi:hypothetical protein